MTAAPRPGPSPSRRRFRSPGALRPPPAPRSSGADRVRAWIPPSRGSAPLDADSCPGCQVPREDRRVVHFARPLSFRSDQEEVRAECATVGNEPRVPCVMMIVCCARYITPGASLCCEHPMLRLMQRCSAYRAV